MIRALLLTLLAAGLLAACTGGGATEYVVTVRFNTTVTQDDMDDVDAFLRAYDEDLDFLIQESFPPTGVATLRTDAEDFCATVKSGLEAKSYIDDVTCREAGEEIPVSSPDQPVTYP